MSDGAWASAQSRPVRSRDDLLLRVAEVEARYEGRSVPRPPHWGGYRVVPFSIEYWVEGDYRLHDRFVYEALDGGGWGITRLCP